MPSAISMPRFGPRDITVIIGLQDKVLVIRVTPLPAEKV
jgi:hypothetical protein